MLVSGSVYSLFLGIFLFMSRFFKKGGKSDDDFFFLFEKKSEIAGGIFVRRVYPRKKWIHDHHHFQTA